MTLEEKQALVDQLATLILAKPLPFLLDTRGGNITPVISSRVIFTDFTRPRPSTRKPGPCQVIPFKKGNSDV